MPGRRDRWGWCERCGRRRVRDGRICRRCERESDEQLRRARGLVNRALVGLGYAGTVRGLRDQVLPEIRRAGMAGLRLGAPTLQARLNAIMVRERLARGWVA